MAQDWQVNYLALCIKQGRWRDSQTGEVVEIGPKAGQILRVTRVARGWVPENQGHLLLGLDGHGRDLFASSRFVKIKPDWMLDCETKEAFGSQREQTDHAVEAQLVAEG